MKSPKGSTAKSIDDDICKFNAMCTQAEFSESDLNRIYKQVYKLLWIHKFKKIGKALVLGIILYFFTVNIIRYTLVGNIAAALSRTAMIKVLPYWNWEILFNKQCLVVNPLYREEFLTEEDCMSCESLIAIDIVENISYDSMVNDYLTRDAPVIVTDAMDRWPIMNDYEFSIANITQLYLYDEKVLDTFPCSLSTNIRYRSSDLISFLKLVEANNIDKYFIHWRNCDIDAVKSLRTFCLRPYFLSNTVAPSHTSWVLLSSDYLSNKFKKIDVNSGLIMAAQAKGKISFKLTPIFPCDEPCLQLKGDLHQGEILVFTSFLWLFEYQPNSNMENIVFITETYWENRSL